MTLLKKPKRKKSDKSKIKDKLDDLWRDIVKACGYCEVCEFQGASSVGKTLNAHHIYGRQDLSLRWDLLNGVCLCVSHHTFSSNFSAHKTPEEFHDWLVKYRGEELLRELKRRRHTSTFHISDLEEIKGNLVQIKANLYQKK